MQEIKKEIFTDRFYESFENVSEQIKLMPDDTGRINFVGHS